MSGPIRGLHDVEGKLFAVSGNTLYQINNNKVAIPRGTIPGVGRVSMEHNQVAGGNQLLVVNGDSGYVWNTADETFQKVTDTGFPGGSTVGFLDGYLCLVEPFGRYLFHSDLADALNYNTLDRFEAETAPDKNIASLIVHQEWWVFGERTVDVFGNTGQATGTFQNKGVSITKGCAARSAAIAIDNGAMWLGNDLVVYHARGYDPVRISTRAIETALSKCSKQAIANAFMFKWESRGHSVAYLTVPGEQTWGYDFSTGLWHRRASYHPVFDMTGRWRLADLVYSNGKWIGGDYQSGKLYELDWDYMMEGCEPLVRERVTPVAHNDMSRFTVDAIKIDYRAGGEETVCVPWPLQPSGPTISGEAPDGQIGVAYTYTYAITAGDAPIARTEIVAGELPDGLAWNESTATMSGTPTEAGHYAITLRVFDTNGISSEITNSFEIVEAAIACSLDSEFAGGESFPAEINVILGTGVGWVELEYSTGGVPDKFEVWLGGVKRIDTGYVGETANQAALDAALAARGLPPETVTQRTGTGTVDNSWNNPALRDRASFYKSTSSAIALVRVYGPIAATAWKFALSCPDDTDPPP